MATPLVELGNPDGLIRDMDFITPVTYSRVNCIMTKFAVHISADYVQCNQSSLAFVYGTRAS